MNTELLLNHFGRVSDAPDAISRLRRFILDLAVRGKLVEQDPNDERASLLMKRICAEKQELTREGRIKRQEDAPPFIEGDEPFSIPSAWVWTRLGQVGDWGSGSTPPRGSDGNYGGGITWLKSGELNDNTKLSGSEETVTELAVKKGSFRRNQIGDVLLAMYGATIGKAAILAEPAVTNQAVCGCTPFTGVFNRYLYTFLLSQRAELHSSSEGGAQPNISKVKIVAFPFPLPPLAEQHRIVAKVNELMELCDRLEAAQAERRTRLDRFASTSLYHLNNGRNAEDLRLHSQFCLTHIPRLTTYPEQIGALRRSILNLAVRGRLVHQEPNDEPASELLKRIQVEKAQLVKVGGLKKDKAIWDGLPKAPPHTIPPNWTWTCLQDVFEISRGGSPRPAGDPRYFGGNIPWITVGEITKDAGKYLTNTEGGLTEEGAERSRFINPGDLLLTNSGATLGVPKISQIRGCMNDGVAVLRQFHSVSLNDFAYLYLQSQTEAFRQVNQGMGQPNLNTPIIAGWFFPIPPIYEQRRIVAKVDELMKLCDRLESQLDTTRTASRKLLEAVLSQAIGNERMLHGDHHASTVI